MGACHQAHLKICQPAVADGVFTGCFQCLCEEEIEAQIIKKLNISKGTVSKALNGASDVSETLRKTVFETAVELGYSRSMHKKDAKRLCIFIENMDYLKESDFGYDIILGFKQMAEPAGFIVEINPIDKNIQTHIKYDEYMLKHDYVGAFFLGLTLVDIWFEQLKSSKTPAVLLDNYITHLL